MPVDKQVQLRYEVLNKCFRDLYREYTIDDLVDACNKAMLREFDMEDGVSKRTVQNDIANLQMPPYNIRLDENLKNGRKRIYRYYDTNFTLPQFRMNDSDRNKIQAAVNVLENYGGEPLLDWARTLLMQIESGLFGSDSSSVVSFQSNPDLKNISLFGDLLQAILNKKKADGSKRTSDDDPLFAIHEVTFDELVNLHEKGMGFRRLPLDCDLSKPGRRIIVIDIDKDLYDRMSAADSVLFEYP